MDEVIRRVRFHDLGLHDEIFATLKQDYQAFPAWFARKHEEEAYVCMADERLVGFMYLKSEAGIVADTTPQLPPASRIKIGTFKVLGHGTRLGQRFLKKAFDHAIAAGARQLYTTIFPRHTALVDLLVEFGFRQVGTKTTADGTEHVLLKDFDRIDGQLRHDYPMVVRGRGRSFLLSIYPEYHTQLFPDSILRTETYDAVTDVSHTNSIEKCYVSFADTSELRPTDKLIIYRTSDEPGRAWYRSVATSVCTIEQLRRRDSFADVKEYIAYTEPFSVFTTAQLRGWWSRPELSVIKMLYSAALTKRLTRKDLVETVGLDADARWTLLPMTDEQFIRILAGGGVDAGLVVN